MKTLSLLLSSFLAATALPAHDYDGILTRGIGLYPGAPEQDFSPTLAPDTAYRNIALHRITTQSSAYDYNLTAQLATDGIVETTSPAWLETFVNGTPLPKREREWAIDGGEYSRNTLVGATSRLEFLWHGMTIRADRVRIVCSVAYDEQLVGETYSFRISTKDAADIDAPWHDVAAIRGEGLPGEASATQAHRDPNKQTGTPTLPVRDVVVDMPLSSGATTFAALQVEMSMEGAAHWAVTELKLYLAGDDVTDILPSSNFHSAWMSLNGGEQWLCVDFGATAVVDRVTLHWIAKATEGRIEMSDDALTWSPVATLPGGSARIDDITIAPTKGRYLRLVMQHGECDERYILSEMEVMGRGALAPTAKERKGLEGDDYYLDGGEWRLQRASQAKGTAREIASARYDTSEWLCATVPATVLMSYVGAGALPNPNYADNMMNISEAYFNADFWYRTEFVVPETMRGRHIFLCMDGINWKAEALVNGQCVDRIEGAFRRGYTEITKYLVDGTNVLAIKIERNAHIGMVKEKYAIDTDFNGGILGRDNPTFHATIGWDWISTIRGRDIGVWNDIFLHATGPVTLRDALLTTTIAPGDTLATMTPTVVVSNNEPTSINGTLRGWIGDIVFERQITLPIYAETEVTFSPDEFPQLRDRTMNLWWPNGYGSPFLYDAGFEFTTKGQVSDRTDYKAGIREMSYRDADSLLTLYVNGRRFVPTGGNWGFSENNLCYREREYDIAVGLHRAMHFNCIRNWVGQTGDKEFYEACDRNGIMVWQDFWLANPADGPDPADEAMFLRNAADYVRRIRQHPSIAIYCGRNEGYPPATIDAALRQYVAALHPGLLYISSSADDGVSGHGPYRALPPEEYFARQTGKLHTERGMPNVMTYEGLARTLRPETLWPQGDAWGQHDYCLRGAQYGATFNAMINAAFGEPDDARTFTEWAQWVNYDGYRAMCESANTERRGLLIWMSHACWPSMTWQCYDYYFEPTAAFFACKKACEPLHIQWNALTRDVQIANICCGNLRSLTARRDIIDARGRLVDSAIDTTDCPNDATIDIPSLRVDDAYDLDGGNVFFVRLQLSDGDGNVLSENTYATGNERGNLRELLTLPRANVTATIIAHGDASDDTARRALSIDVTNNADTPALMLRLNLTGDDGEQILPALYSDNYFHLMPHESRLIEIAWSAADSRRCSPVVLLSGFNVDLIAAQ